LKTPEKVVVKNQRKNKVPKKKYVFDPCGDKMRMRSGADNHETGHNFHSTEQEMYGRHRGHRYIGYTVSLAA